MKLLVEEENQLQQANAHKSAGGGGEELCIHWKYLAKFRLPRATAFKSEWRSRCDMLRHFSFTLRTAQYPKDMSGNRCYRDTRSI